FIHRPGGEPFAFAGLWETWSDPQGGEIDTAAILTTEANRTLAPLHERMPCIVAPENFDRWLDADTVPPAAVADILAPAPEDFFQAYPISTRVNAVVNDDPTILEPLADTGTPPAEERPAPRKAPRSKDSGQMDLF